MTVLLSVDTAWHEQLGELFPHAPATRDRFIRDAKARWQTGLENAHLQAGYLILAARATGLSVGPMSGFDRTGVDKEFFNGRERASFLVLNFGYPGAAAWKHPRLPRLSTHEVLDVASCDGPSAGKETHAAVHMTATGTVQ